MSQDQINEDREIIAQSYQDDKVIMDVLKTPHSARQRRSSKKRSSLQVLRGGKKG